jgi:hypothetical protein
MTANGISKYVRGLSTPEIDRVCDQLTKTGTLTVTEKTTKGTSRYGLAEELEA